jgi:tetratricopeptide (TPR) repeat protein/DNA polymerase III delta prime subunit
MFTDIVASTELIGRLGLHAATELQRIHDRLLATAVGACNGRYVKSTGDGMMATFSSAQDAVTAAVGVQRSVEAHSRRSPALAFGIRIGLSAGDVVWNDDGSDCIGTAVNEAARLTDIASGGQILASEVVRSLARDASVAFGPAEAVELKGFAQPLMVSGIAWTPGPAGLLAVPGPLRIDEAAPGYVGRADVLASLRRSWQEIHDDRSRCVLLSGEPGVGKTRTAAQLADELSTEGVLVLYGGCQEGIGAPYRPFAEALDHHTSTLRDPDLGWMPGELRRLLPELTSRVPGLPEPLSSDPRTEEFRLFEAIGSWLASASVATGLLLVLDDLHWAGTPTLLALTHLLDTIGNDPSARLLIVGTYRDSDVDRAHQLTTLLARTASGGVERHALTGLSADEVTTFVQTSAGHELDERGIALAQKVHAETEGNPFFVGEVLRHLTETGTIRRDGDRWTVDDVGAVTVPPNVRDVVRRRLSYLSEDTQSLLSTASVLGRDFDVPVLAALVSRDEDEIVGALESALGARLLHEVGPDRFRFAHALVKETLYDELSATRRRRLHRKVIDVLERLRPYAVVPLAYHCVAAGPDSVDRGRAASYLLAAAGEAQQARALADAEWRYRHALDLVDEDPALEHLAVDATIGVGECQRDQGDPSYRKTLISAAERAGEDTPRLVAAVLANRRGVTTVVGEVDVERVALAERALARLGSERSEDRARLLAYLATEITFTGASDRRLSLVDEAESIARRLGNSRVLADVLVRTAFPAIALDRIEALVARGRESVELADATGDPALQAEARSLWAWALLAAGDLRAAEQTNRDAAAIAAEAGASSLKWMTRYWLVAHLGAAGRFTEAATLNDELLAVAEAGGEPDGLNWWGAASTALALLQGGVGDLADLIGQFADQYPALPTWRAAHAEALAEAGRIAEARAVLDKYPIDVAALARDPYALVGLGSLAHAAWLIGDQELAERVFAVVEPHSRRWAHLFIGITGPVSWSIGRCLLALGRLDEGVAALRAAVADATAQGCIGVAMRARLDLAGALARRGATGDATEAHELAQDVRTWAVTADSGGLVRLAETVDSRGWADSPT